MVGSLDGNGQMWDSFVWDHFLARGPGQSHTPRSGGISCIKRGLSCFFCSVDSSPLQVSKWEETEVKVNFNLKVNWNPV